MKTNTQSNFKTENALDGNSAETNFTYINKTTMLYLHPLLVVKTMMGKTEQIYKVKKINNLCSVLKL